MAPALGVAALSVPPVASLRRLVRLALPQAPDCLTMTP